jgi:hypothetical protein
LRADSARERWDGFWCGDDYVARRTDLLDGSVHWFRVVDVASPMRVASTRARGARVLAFRAPRRMRDARQMLVFYSRSGRRPILIGTSRRAGPR